MSKGSAAPIPVVPSPLRATPANYVEEVRLRWERELEAEARPPADAEPDRFERSPLDPSDPSADRFQALADEVCSILRGDGPVKLYRAGGSRRSPNAFVDLWDSAMEITLLGRVAQLSDRAFRALIGHEIGHHLAHGWRSNPPSTLRSTLSRHPANAYGRAGYLSTELTADRFALLAAQDVDAMVELELASDFTHGTQLVWMPVKDYVEECLRNVDRGMDLVHAESGYPTVPFRIYATRLFWTSDVFQRLTGLGPGLNSLRDIDDLLRALGTRAIARAAIPLPNFFSSDTLADWRHPHTGARDEPSRPPSTSADVDDDDDPLAMDEPDDLERRFRDLERRQGRPGKT